VLTRVLAIDPEKYLSLLPLRQFRRAASSFARAQRSKTTPSAFRRSQPFINGCAAEAVRGDNLAGILAVPNALDGHSPDFLQRFVIQSPAVPLHAESVK
jgi:hypothetical protein